MENSSEGKTFPIVGVGASAGGLEALTRLMQRLPPDTGMALVIIQHLDPGHPSALVELLSRTTSMPVVEVTNDVRVHPNRVYVIPPNAGMSMAKGKLRLEGRQVRRGAHRAIDYFFESLAEDQGECAIGIILSGTASDGTVGLEAIKAEGGITFAQDGSAKYDSMPRSAVAAGCVDLVLSPEQMAEELARIAHHPSLKEVAWSEGPASTGQPGAPDGEDAAGAQGAPAEQVGYNDILLRLMDHFGVDFSVYKPRTIHRRINRRMVLNRVQTLEAYARILGRNPEELSALYSDMLISVTTFFRNPEAFEVLKMKVFPKLVQHRRGEPVRMWVLGCAAGQEAYSIAMAFTEFADTVRGAPKLQIFASDLNEQLLEKARQGLYAASLVQDVSPERLQRFFIEEPGGFRFAKPLRDSVIFARHNLLTDPPFSRLDLTSCRNVLIYLNTELQSRILSSFHYGLKPGGFLFLGVSESVGQSTELFEPVDKKLRIYARKPGLTPAWHVPIALRARSDRKDAGSAQGFGPPVVSLELNAQREADRLLVNQFAPPGVLINAELQILQFRGSTGSFLEPPAGRATHDLLKMAREGLKAPLRALVEQVKAEDKMVRKDGVHLWHEGQTRSVALEAIPLKNLKDRCYLILFRLDEVPRSTVEQRATGVVEPAGDGVTGQSAWRDRIGQLERELAETRDYVQSIQEQYETANEQLQVFNEEVTSGNEELQSVNEELETSKEELESSNEELTTINEELAGRNSELNRLNAELNNLHTSINTPILVLGPELSIRRFTAPAAKVFNLLAGDVGRALSGVRHSLELPELEKLLAEVIASGRPVQREVRDQAGHWFDLRARPYLTLDNRIDGAVLMLVDIDALKEAEHRLRESRDYAEAVIESVPPLLILNPGLRVVTANASFYRSFQATAGETIGRVVFDLGNGHWNIAKLRHLLEEVLPRNFGFRDFEVTHDFEHIGRRTMMLSGSRVQHLDLILLAMEDITACKEAEETARNAREVMTRYASDLEGFSYALAHDMRAPLRAMRSFASLIVESDGERFSPQSRDYLERIGSSAQRLDELIRDSLSYAQSIREEMPLQPVELCQLLRGMIGSYPNLQASEVDFAIECEKTVVRANAAGLTQCFSNLLGNAVKFVRDGEKPRVRVWVEESGDRVRVWVEDHGIGIPEDCHEKIFEMFQRLHRSEEYPGTGVGLALVRKVVQRMGGRVGLESTPGQGSRFWVELRKATPA